MFFSLGIPPLRHVAQLVNSVQTCADKHNSTAGLEPELEPKGPRICTCRFAKCGHSICNVSSEHKGPTSSLGPTTL